MRYVLSVLYVVFSFKISCFERHCLNENLQQVFIINPLNIMCLTVRDSTNTFSVFRETRVAEAKYVLYKI